MNLTKIVGAIWSVQQFLWIWSKRK